MRAQVAGSIWPEKPERRALANLRSTLWRLRTKGIDAVVEDQQQTLSLHPGASVDIVAAIADSGELSVDELLSELLPGWSEPWLDVHRTRWRQLRLHALDRLGAEHLERGDVEEAVAVAEQLIASEPMRETTIRLLVAACLELGDYPRALREIDRYKGELRQSYGVAVSGQLASLEHEVRSSLQSPAVVEG